MGTSPGTANKNGGGRGGLPMTRHGNDADSFFGGVRMDSEPKCGLVRDTSSSLYETSGLSPEIKRGNREMF